MNEDKQRMAILIDRATYRRLSRLARMHKRPVGWMAVTAVSLVSDKDIVEQTPRKTRHAAAIRERLAAMEAHTDRMSPRQLQVFALVNDGKTQTEVGELLGISRQAVSQALWRPLE